MRTAGDLRNYVLVTGAYWADTIADGAIRVLVLFYFYFYELGYSPFAVASLFLFYELFGIVTNLVGGWLAARLGLRATLLGGLSTQLVALLMLAVVPDAWLVVPYVMASQALSGIAKDLTKMSSKTAVKLVVPEDAPGALYKWVAILTGSKNALKGKRRSVRCSRTPGRSTSWPPRGSSCSPPATCGSSSASRCSCAPSSAGASGRSGASLPSG